ncbi:hypothetical protein [Aquisalimonas asiatica]|uniref:Uncharacterized protein n=1 Tax=Aquisalimonas asiatica TaxID=406100 RepID=A0A1H8TEN7_9GAMM|nr:hypothetical protein [Aquisalimonas asiatica]SEO89341.1 hypothetical protein SAMN04488052_104112 [Aquisalimonas asiatica]
MQGCIPIVRGVSFFLVFSVAPALSVSAVADACETVAQPVERLGGGEPLEGVEVQVNPQLRASVPDGPSRVVHNNVVIILDYDDGARIAFREVERSELEPAIGDTPVGQFLEWAFDTPVDELPADDAAAFAKDYGKGLCAEALQARTRDEVAIYAGAQGDGNRFAIIANQADDHGFMHVSTRQMDKDTFGRLLESIGTRR